MSTDSICPICYENLGKIYRTLRCGHKFHHKCLKNCEKKDDTIHNCPYCRQEYENIILRKRITILSVEEKDIKKNFIKYMKEMLNMCESTNGKVPRLLICNKIFKNIINNQKIILDVKYGFIPLFTKTVFNKVNEIHNEVKILFDDGEITNEYNEFCGYRQIILQKFREFMY